MNCCLDETEIGRLYLYYTRKPQKDFVLFDEVTVSNDRLSDNILKGNRHLYNYMVVVHRGILSTR